jgi:hypothetical protein
VKQEFDSAREYRMLFTGGQLTFTFLAPLKRPAAASEVTLQFHDATFFASFSLPEGAVTLTKAPKGCTGTLSLPKSRQGASQKTLVNTLNEALSAGGSPEPSSSRFTVTCLDQVAPAGYTQPVAPALDGPYPVFGATGSMLTLLRVLVSLLVAVLVWSVVAVRRPGAP